MAPVFEAPDDIHVKCCATCKHWGHAEGEGSAHGYCEVNTYPKSHEELWSPMLTLDLAKCSRWQAKQDSE